MVPLDGSLGNLLPYPRGECLGSTDCCLLCDFLLIGGFITNSEIVTGYSGYYFKFYISLYLFFSALSHFVTSKDALAFYNLSNYLTFSIISSLSFSRLRSLFKLEMLLECLYRIVEVFAFLSPFLADNVDRSDRALGCRCRYLGCESVLKALPSRYLGAIFACVAIDRDEGKVSKVLPSLIVLTIHHFVSPSGVLCSNDCSHLIE